MFTGKQKKKTIAGIGAGVLTVMGVAAAAPSGSAAADAALQTLRITAHSTGQHSTGKTSFVDEPLDEAQAILRLG